MADNLVTDPELLKRLQAASTEQAPANVVTDPALLERLRVAANEQSQPEQQRSTAGRIASFLGAPDPNAPADPYGANATIGRIATGIVGGIPDLAIKFQNAGLNPIEMISTGMGKLLGRPGVVESERARLPEITPLMRQATGTPELPEDAGAARRFLEGAATVAASGGARAVGQAISQAPSAAAAVMPAVAATARNIVAPVVGSEVGGSVGEKIGGEKGALIGSVVGGLAGNAPNPSSLVERYYGRQARPNAPDIAAAAERQGITPTAGMLGNEKIQDLERSLAGRGTGPFPNPVINARERTLVQMRERADQAAAARGGVQPQPTPGTIGEHVLGTAEQAAGDLRGQSSAAQQSLMDRVGENAPVNVAGIYAALRNEIARTEPGFARPMEQRLANLVEMMPVDRTGRIIVGPGGEINVPYGRMKDWRTNLGRGTQTQEPVPAGHLDQIYGPTTNAMREAAVSQGVLPHEFDAAMGVTRALTGSGGPVQYFEKVAGREGTSGERVGALSPERAFNRVVDEQNPQGLQRLEQHAPQALDRIAGDTLRLRAQETLGAGGTGGTGAPIEGIRGGGAAGARKFANWWENMSPEAQRILGGNQAPTMRDLADLAGAFNYPTRQTGLSRAMGGQAAGLATRFGTAGILGEIARAIGIPKAIGWGAGMYGVTPAITSLHGALLQSGPARRGLSGNYTPHATPTLADLIAQLTAAGIAR